VHGDDTDIVVGGGDHHRSEAVTLHERLPHAIKHVLLLDAERVAVDALVRDDRKLRGIDRVSALAEDFALRPFLPAIQQELAHVLEFGSLGYVVAGEHLGLRQRRAVAREHVGDLALPHRDEIGLVDAIGERKEEMDAAAEDFRLKPRLAVQGDEA
jgi:hypothetical protein